MYSSSSSKWKRPRKVTSPRYVTSPNEDEANAWLDLQCFRVGLDPLKATLGDIISRSRPRYWPKILWMWVRVGS